MLFWSAGATGTGGNTKQHLDYNTQWERGFQLVHLIIISLFTSCHVMSFFCGHCLCFFMLRVAWHASIRQGTGILPQRFINSLFCPGWLILFVFLYSLPHAWEHSKQHWTIKDSFSALAAYGRKNKDGNGGFVTCGGNCYYRPYSIYRIVIAPIITACEEF